MKLPVQHIVLEQEIPLPRSKVWELLSNTDHLNRFIGLFPVRFGAAVNHHNALFWDAVAKMNGIIPMRWKEYPFEWEKERHYAVLREYSKGPLKRFYAGIELKDAHTELVDGSRATIVRLFSDVLPAGVVGLIGTLVVGKQSMSRTMQYLVNYEELMREGKVDDRPQLKPSNKIASSELHTKIEALRELLPEDKLIMLLKEHLLTSGDDEVIDMRPYAIADRWGVDRYEVLKLFLYATKQGIVNLIWHLICPNCRVSKNQVGTLSQLENQVHCEFCGINYTTSFDKYVELCFSVHPSIRIAYKQLFCIGGPAISPHVISQVYIEANASKSISSSSKHGVVRLRVLRNNDMLLLQHSKSEESHSEVLAPYHLTYGTTGWLQSSPLMVGHEQELSIHNDTNTAIVVVMEQEQWNDQIVTAAYVTTRAEFRGMFSSEVLAPGQQVGVESIALLFSDLLGSTTFYETVGDAVAYGQVRKHFDYINSWVEKNQGSVVKTIGDAVMAVFQKPENALQASIDIQRNIHTFNENYPLEDAVTIKIGIHYGPAIVVNSNNTLDYFGRTVNIAARIQGESHGGDIVLSSEGLDRPELRAMVEVLEGGVEYFTADLKGIENAMHLVRITKGRVLSTPQDRDNEESCALQN